VVYGCLWKELVEGIVIQPGEPTGEGDVVRRWGLLIIEFRDALCITHNPVNGAVSQGREGPVRFAGCRINLRTPRRHYPLVGTMGLINGPSGSVLERLFQALVLSYWGGRE
jgi:hypothetical protein